MRLEGITFRPRDTTQALYRLAKLQRPFLLWRQQHSTQQLLATSREVQEAAAARGEVLAQAVSLLSDLVLRQAEEFDAWSLSLALWSYGVLEHSDEGVLGALCRRGAAAMRHFKPIDCAMALVGWARLRVRTRSQREFVDVLLGHTLDALSDNVGDWRSQELANTAWALAKVGAAGSQRRALLDTLMEVVQWRLDDFNMQVGYSGGAGVARGSGGQDRWG